MWGALLRGLTFLPTVGKWAVDFAKNHKFLTTGGAIGTAIVGSTFLPEKKKEQQETTQQASQQEQTKQQEQAKKQPKQKSHSSGGNGNINLPPLESLFQQQGSNVSNADIPLSSQQSNGDELSQIANRIQDLFVDLDKHRQMYEVLSQQYLQANEIYEKQLLQTMQIIPILLAKTPLNNMTNEDLLHHVNSLFTSMPYSTAIDSVNQVIKGYYLAKANGVDPSSLSTTDLTEIAENPVLAKSVDENLAQFLEQMGEILKYKIKSNMDKVGALKDQYQNILKELEEKGKLYKEIIDAYKSEKKFDIDINKFLAMMNYRFASLNEKKYYHDRALGLREREVRLKEEKAENGKSSGNLNKGDPFQS